MTRHIITFISIIFICCSGPEEQVVDRWDDNAIKTKKVFFNERDTAQYILIKYFENGQQSEKTKYVGKVKNGWSIVSYDNGAIKDSTFFLKNIPVKTTVVGW